MPHKLATALLVIILTMALLPATRTTAQDDTGLRLKVVPTVGAIATGDGCPMPRNAELYITIQAAINCTQDGDTVVIVAGTYRENLIISTSITLQGDELENVILDGGETGSVITLEREIAVTLERLTITGGKADDGGGVYAFDSDLTVLDSVITGNVTERDGAGIYLRGGDLHIENTVINQNLAEGAIASGGGIAHRDGNLILLGVTVQDNTCTSSGCGVYTYDGELIITDSTISGNIGGDTTSGAGVMNYSGNTSAENTVFAGNQSEGSGGGLFSYTGTLTLTDCTVSGNAAGQGGGVYGYSGDVILKGTLVSNNTADMGGGVWVYEGRLIADESEITGNAAEIWGGGVYTQTGTLEIADTTVISGNTAGVDDPDIHTS